MKSMSIHPRVRDGRTVYDKSNTAKPKKEKARRLDKKQERLNNRRNACVATRKANHKLPEGAFRMPGSMNQHKR